MSTSVKYFHSELPGAPVLSGTAGSLLAVLDACLVNGWGLLTAQSVSVVAEVCTLTFATAHAFEPLTVAVVAGAGTAAINGEQRVTVTSTNSISFSAPGVPDGPVSGTITAKIAPAGWVKTFSDTDKSAYKSAAPDASGCVARIDDRSGRFARLRAFKSMTDVDTGVGPTPMDAQVSGGLYILKSDLSNTASRRWVVVASDRFVHLAIAPSGTYVVDYDSVAFGDFPSLKSGDAYNFVVVGDIYDMSGSTSPGTYNALHFGQSSSGAYIVCSYTQIGGAVPASLYKPGFVSGNFSGAQVGGSFPVGPNPINGGVEICPTMLLEGNLNGNRRGEIPGLYGIPHALGASFDSKDQLVPAVGLPGHVLIALRIGGYQAASSSGRFALDVTGPWS